MTDPALAEAFTQIGFMMATNSRDWSADRGDAWLYAVLVGWGCEDDHDHDSDTPCPDTLSVLAERFGWRWEVIQQITLLRAAVRQATRAVTPAAPNRSIVVTELRRAADLMSGRARLANSDDSRRPYGDHRLDPVAETQWPQMIDNYLGGPVGAHCASWTPAVALGVAGWLNSVALGVELAPEWREVAGVGDAVEIAVRYLATEGSR